MALKKSEVDCSRWSGCDELRSASPRPEGADSRFLGYSLNTSAISRQNAIRGQGDAAVHRSASALEHIKIRSSLIQERSVVAAVLRDLDAEICTLQSKLTTARRIKQGLLQELFTGRIWLVDPQGATV